MYCNYHDTNKYLQDNESICQKYPYSHDISTTGTEIYSTDMAKCILILDTRMTEECRNLGHLSAPENGKKNVSLDLWCMNNRERAVPMQIVASYSHNIFWIQKGIVILQTLLWKLFCYYNLPQNYISSSNTVQMTSWLHFYRQWNV